MSLLSEPYAPNPAPSAAGHHASAPVIDEMGANLSLTETDPLLKILLIIFILGLVFFVCSALNVFILFTIVLMAGTGFVLWRTLRL